MTCPDCQARQKLIRDAWLNACTNPKEAVKQSIIGALEVSGLKSKTGATDLARQSKPASKRSKKQ